LDYSNALLLTRYCPSVVSTVRYKGSSHDHLQVHHGVYYNMFTSFYV